MDALLEDALVLAILFVWLDGEKQEEILKLLNIKVEERENENNNRVRGHSAASDHDIGSES